MEIRQLTADDVDRFVETLWLPFAREMESYGEWNRLAEDVDLETESREYRRKQLADEDVRIWVAVDATSDTKMDSEADSGEFAGYVAASYHESPPVFARGNRVHFNGVFVHERYRGTDLATDLVACARDWARHLDCEELTVSVGGPNDRARAFYEREDFDVRRHRLACQVETTDASAE